MSDLTVNESQKLVTIKREFEGLDISKAENVFQVIYIERTYIDGELESEKRKSYRRDLQFWMQSQLGVTILEMINNDLVTNNVTDKLNQLINQQD